MVLVAIGVVKLGFGVVDSKKTFAVTLMAPKKRTKLEARSSSKGYDGCIFANAAAHTRYQRMSTKVVIQDMGLECNAEPYRHDPQYDEIRRSIIVTPRIFIFGFVPHARFYYVYCMIISDLNC